MLSQITGVKTQKPNKSRSEEEIEEEKKLFNFTGLIEKALKIKII